MKDAPKQGKLRGSLESGSFFFWLSGSATAEGQRRTKAVMRMQQEEQLKEHRTEMKESKKIEVYPAQWVYLNFKENTKESAIFFGIEHRLRKEEMEEQFNREAKEAWRFAADAARITDERASNEDRKHTSRGVSVAVDSSLGAVVGAEEGVSSMGQRKRRSACILGVLLALGRLDPEE